MGSGSLSPNWLYSLTTMSGIDVIQECEADRGWRFTCRIAGTTQVQLRLDWVDYNCWCPGGGVSPARVAEAVLMCLLDEGVTVGESFDAARIRRLGPDADGLVRRMLDTLEQTS